MHSSMITGAIGIVIAIAIAFQLYPTYQSHIDEYYLYYVPSCELSGNRFVRAYTANSEGQPSGTASTVSKTSGTATTCTNGTALTGVIVDEHGTQISATDLAAAVIANSKWNTVLGLLSEYGGLSKLILSVLPVIGIATFLGLSAQQLFNSQQLSGVGAITSAVIVPISNLIAVIVVLAIAPTIMEFANAVFVQLDGRLSVLDRFGDIIKLVMGFIPVVFNVGLLAAGGVTGYVVNQRLGRRFGR